MSALGLESFSWGRRTISIFAILSSIAVFDLRPVSALDFDQNVTPDILFGSGNANGEFTVDRQTGVELGLRGKVRFDLASDSPQNIFNSNGAGSYLHEAGAPAAQPTRARWSFEWSVNTDYDGSSGLLLDDLTYEIRIDYDPSAATNFLSFDPITPGAVPSWDHSIGTNATANGAGIEDTSPAGYAALLAANNVAQNSWQHNFFSGPLAFDPNANGIYTIELSASMGATEVASTSITVYVGSSTIFTLRSPPVLGPAEPVKVYLDLSTLREDVASVGARLTYDSAKFSFVSLSPGADAPASWSFVYQKTTNPGEIDLVLTDQSAAAAVLAGPTDGAEVVCITFDRVALDCTTGLVDYSSSAPVTAAEISAFPENQYIHYIDSSTLSVVLETPELFSVSGGGVNDHAFVRANVNNRAAHQLDLSDVVDIAAFLFSGYSPSFDCAAAFDANDDGVHNVTDLVTAVQGIFNSSVVRIPPPNGDDPGTVSPGVYIPGVVVPDGGTISSVLGCEDGETCP